MGNPIHSNILDYLLFTVTTLLMLAVVILLSASLYVQFVVYSESIEKIMSKDGSVVAALAFSRSFDFAVTKTISIFMSFLMIFVGALYVLKTIEIEYGLELQARNQGKLSISSSSPGLIIVSLGVLLAFGALYSKTSLSMGDGYGENQTGSTISDETGKLSN